MLGGPRLQRHGRSLGARAPLAVGTAFTLLVLAAGLVLKFAGAVLGARLLGPSGYGTAAFLVALVVTVATLANLGLGNLVVREVPKHGIGRDWAGLNGLIRTALAVPLGLGALAGLAVAAIPAALGEGWRLDYAIAGLVVPVYTTVITVCGISHGFKSTLGAHAPREFLLPFVVTVVLGLAMVLQSPVEVPDYLAIFLAGSTLGMVFGLLIALTSRPDAARGVPAAAGVPATLRRGFPFLLVGMLTIASGEANTLLLGWLAEPRDVGLFQPLLRISSVMILGFVAVLTIYAPRAAERHAEADRQGLERLTWFATMSMTLFTVVVSTVIVVLGPYILGIFGRDFVTVEGALVWFAVAQTVNMMCGPVTELLAMTGHERDTIRAQLAGLAVNLVLGIALIPAHGAGGAVLAMSGAIVTTRTTGLVMVCYRLGFDPSIVGALRATLRRRA